MLRFEVVKARFYFPYIMYFQRRSRPQIVTVRQETQTDSTGVEPAMDAPFFSVVLLRHQLLLPHAFCYCSPNSQQGRTDPSSLGTLSLPPQPPGARLHSYHVTTQQPCEQGPDGKPTNSQSQ
eukprot:sb/3475976/